MATAGALLVALGKGSSRSGSARVNVCFRIANSLAERCGAMWSSHACDIDDVESTELRPGVTLMKAPITRDTGRVIRDMAESNGISMDMILLLHVEVAYVVGRYQLLADLSSRPSGLADSIIDTMRYSRDEQIPLRRIPIGLNTAPEKVPRHFMAEHLDGDLTPVEDEIFEYRIVNQVGDLMLRFAAGETKTDKVDFVNVDWVPQPDRYVIGDQLGRGGFGYVYECFDRESTDAPDGGNRVLKTVRLDKLSSSGAAAVTMREITMLRATETCINVVRLFDTVETALHGEMVTGMVMERVDYVSYTKMFKVFDRVSWAEDPDVAESPYLGPATEPADPAYTDGFATYLYKLLQALASVHAVGIVHKDLKPNNILYDPDKGQLRLIDWGLATHFFENEPTMGMPGSRPYRAPEQCLRHVEVTPAVDMWAIGLMIGTVIFCPFNKINRPFILGGARGSDNSQLMAIAEVVGGEALAAYVEKTGLGWGDTTERERELLVSLEPRNFYASFGERPLATAPLMELLYACLLVDPDLRPTAQEAMASAFFDRVRDACDAQAVADYGSNGDYVICTASEPPAEKIEVWAQWATVHIEGVEQTPLPVPHDVSHRHAGPGGERGPGGPPGPGHSHHSHGHHSGKPSHHSHGHHHDSHSGGGRRRRGPPGGAGGSGSGEAGPAAPAGFSATGAPMEARRRRRRRRRKPADAEDGSDNDGAGDDETS